MEIGCVIRKIRMKNKSVMNMRCMEICSIEEKRREGKEKVINIQKKACGKTLLEYCYDSSGNIIK